MLYQLPNGKVIEMSTEQYLEMSDEELEYIIAWNYGEELENPWFGSVIHKHVSLNSSEEPLEILPNTDITEIPLDDKIDDLDVDREYPDVD